MNPRTIDSTNVEQFGFKTTIDIEERVLTFDIAGLTVFKTGGAAAITGISFEVIDPFGVTIHALQFVTPDIDTGSATTYEMDLPSGLSLFGKYQIRGVLREADAVTDYEVKLPLKDVCEPIGFDGEVVPGTFKERVDCNSPYIRLNETTNLVYLNKSYTSVTKNGSLYYPAGTLDPLVFTKTPAQTKNVYTGDYVVRNKTVADYDLGDYFFVRIGYETNYKFSVTCQSRLCDIMCCIDDVYNDSIKYCNTAKGSAAKAKLESIYIDLFSAMSLEKCGKDAGKQIKNIKDKLNCDCDCNSKPIEPSPINAGGGNTITFEDQCAAEVDEDTVGSNTTVTIKVKNVLVGKSNALDTAFTIQKIEDECSISWLILFNYSILADTILDTIGGSETLRNLLNSLITHPESSGYGPGDIDGGGIINLNNCEYFLTYDIPVNGALIKNIIIAGDIYPAPGSGILVSSPATIESWLNSLNRGVWTVSWTAAGVGGTIGVQSNAHPYAVATSLFDLSGIEIVKTYTRDCHDLEDILQAILDYLKLLDSTQIKIGQVLSVCTISGSTVNVAQYGASTQLSTYMQALSVAFCDLVNKVKDFLALTCSDVVGLFETSGAPIQATDYWLGTKAGTCAKGTIKELAIALFQLAQSDGQVKEAFCAVGCSTAACPAVKDLQVVNIA